MALSDNKINAFFSKHKTGSLSSLKEKNKPNKVSHSSNQDEQPTSILLKNDESSINKNKEQLAKIREQAVNNPAAIHKQTVSNSLAVREQTVSNSLAICEQTVSDQLAIREQFVSNSLADPLAKVPTKTQKYEYCSLEIYSTSEQNLLQMIYQKCVNNCSQLCTIESTEIMNIMGISSERVRNLFHRITKKGGIQVIANKSGRNASRKIEMSKNLYTQLNEKSNMCIPLANPLATLPYSSSINNTTTKTNIDEKIIDISLLSDYGFFEEHIQQLLRITSENKPLNPDVIQNSINYFYYDLKYNGKEKEIKKTPVQFFMGIMRNEKIYNPPKNYKSQAEIAMDIILAQQTEEQDRFNKKIEELKKVKCEQWLNELDNEEKNKILSAKNIDHKHTPEIAFLRIYYSNNIWPDVKNNLLDNDVLESNRNITTP